MESDSTATLRNCTEADGFAGSERYRDVLRASVDWLWSCDRDLILREIAAPTAAGERLVPHTPIGDPLSVLFAGAPDSGDSSPPAQLVSRRAFRDLPARLGSLDVLLSGVPTFDADGRFSGYRGSMRQADDTTDTTAWSLLREFEQLLMRSNEIEWRLGEAAHRAKTTQDRLASLLHELRTPLNAVNGYADLARERLRTGGGEKALEQDIERLREAGEHITQMLQGFQHAAIEGGMAGKTGLDRSAAPASASTDPNDAMCEARAMVDLSARQAGVRVHAPPPEAANTPPIRAERNTVMQILVNLLTNAVKFTPEGGEVGMSISDTADGRVRIAVWDTGPGIDPHEHERIFERRYRVAATAADGANQNAPDGQGLGLSISRELARAAGGDLTVESRPSAGATFIIDFPVAHPDATACA